MRKVNCELVCHFKEKLILHVVFSLAFHVFFGVAMHSCNLFPKSLHKGEVGLVVK